MAEPECWPLAHPAMEARGGRILAAFLSCVFSLCLARPASGEALITQPAPPAAPSLATVYKPGAPLEILGTASGALFRRYSVEWARGLNATDNWSAAGIVLAGGGTNSVAGGLLASWDSSMVTQADWCSIRLTVEQAAGADEAQTCVYLEPDLYATDWPQWLDGAIDASTSIMPTRDASGRAQLAMVDSTTLNSDIPSRLRLFDLDGSSFSTRSLDGGGLAQPAVGTWGTGAGDTIVVPEAFDLRVYRPDGMTSTLLPTNRVNFQFSAVTLADLDGDGQSEILGIATDYEQSLGWLYAWRADGTLFSANYPVPIPDLNMPLGLNQQSRLVPVDLDGDGKPELVVVGRDDSESFSLHAFRGDGTPANWPTITVAGDCFGVASGDVDGDGLPEIVVTYSYPRMYPNFQYWVAVYSVTGALRPGWPVGVDMGSPVGLALADLDRDGAEEIILTGGWNSAIDVFKGDGTEFPGKWPVFAENSYQLFGTPIVADIDGDGFPEIIVTRNDTVFRTQDDYYSDARLLAFRTNGTLARFWRLQSAGDRRLINAGTPVVGDFDGDGHTDLAVPYLMAPGFDTGNFQSSFDTGALTVLRLGTPYRPSPRDWPLNMHDRRNSSASLVPATLRAAKHGGNLVLTWALRSEPARLEFTESLPPPSMPPSGWQPLGITPTPTNGINSVTLQPPQHQRWYRLRYEGQGDGE